ncbi:MAG: hypothetical protein PVI03_01335 [Candidatus Thorarchaeota archaeon]|jgi:uncharacterized repeat protein (TIGR04076 family)
MRDIRLEIFESECRKHRVGQKFKYEEDAGKICPWLLDSPNTMIRVLKHDGCLGWSYKGTPYEKVINKDGVTTEFVRCSDPTSSEAVLKTIAKKRTKRKSREQLWVREI